MPRHGELYFTISEELGRMRERLDGLLDRLGTGSDPVAREDLAAVVRELRDGVGALEGTVKSAGFDS